MVGQKVTLAAYLIREVKKNEILYDTKHPDYKNLAEKERVWEQIATSARISVDSCKRKWKALRDSYTRIIRYDSLREAKGLSDKRQRRIKWRYFEPMNFLKDYTKATCNMDYFPGIDETSQCFLELDEEGEIKEAARVQNHNTTVVQQEEEENAPPDEDETQYNQTAENEQLQQHLQQAEFIYADEDTIEFLNEDLENNQITIFELQQTENVAEPSIATTTNLQNTDGALLQPKQEVLPLVKFEGRKRKRTFTEDENLQEQQIRRDSTTLLFSSLAAKLNEANMPHSLLRNIELQVTQLVYTVIQDYEESQTYSCNE